MRDRDRDRDQKCQSRSSLQWGERGGLKDLKKSTCFFVYDSV